MSRAMIQGVLAVAILCSTAVVSPAQTTTSSSETKSFAVLAVDGNQLVVRLPEGTRELSVADDFRFTVDGKQLSVRELKPGMKGTATITTRTTVTPVTVTEVKNGTVRMQSGSSIIVQTDEGIKMFTQGELDKRGVRLMRDGRAAQLSEFRAGDTLSATIITSRPPRVMTQKEVDATLATGPAAAGSAAPVAAARAQTASPAPGAGAAGSASSAAPARTLPRTASSWPLLGLVSAVSLALGLALTVRRRFVG